MENIIINGHKLSDIVQWGFCYLTEGKVPIAEIPREYFSCGLLKYAIKQKFLTLSDMTLKERKVFYCGHKNMPKNKVKQNDLTIEFLFDNLHFEWFSVTELNQFAEKINEKIEKSYHYYLAKEYLSYGFDLALIKSQEIKEELYHHEYDYLYELGSFSIRQYCECFGILLNQEKETSEDVIIGVIKENKKSPYKDLQNNGDDLLFFKKYILDNNLSNLLKEKMPFSFYSLGLGGFSEISDTQLSFMVKKMYKPTGAYNCSANILPMSFDLFLYLLKKKLQIPKSEVAVYWDGLLTQFLSKEVANLQSAKLIIEFGDTAFNLINIYPFELSDGSKKLLYDANNLWYLQTGYVAWQDMTVEQKLLISPEYADIIGSENELDSFLKIGLRPKFLSLDRLDKHFLYDFVFAKYEDNMRFYKPSSYHSDKFEFTKLSKIPNKHYENVLNSGIDIFNHTYKVGYFFDSFEEWGSKELATKVLLRIIEGHNSVDLLGRLKPKKEYFDCKILSKQTGDNLLSLLHFDLITQKEEIDESLLIYLDDKIIQGNENNVINYLDKIKHLYGSNDFLKYSPQLFMAFKIGKSFEKSLLKLVNVWRNGFTQITIENKDYFFGVQEFLVDENSNRKVFNVLLIDSEKNVIFEGDVKYYPYWWLNILSKHLPLPTYETTELKNVRLNKYFELELLSEEEKIFDCFLNSKNEIRCSSVTEEKLFLDKKVIIYERTFLGEFYDYCAVCDGKEFHAKTENEAYVGLASKFADEFYNHPLRISRREKQAITEAQYQLTKIEKAKNDFEKFKNHNFTLDYDFFRKVFDWCETGVNSFINDNKIDIDRTYTGQDLANIALANVAINKKYASNLERLGVII